MPVSANFSMEAYSSRGDRGRRSSESSSASDATREVSAEATENIPTRRKSVGPKPANNPMKFVAAGPAPLLRTASEQMLKAEKLRMAAKPAVKEEESAAWQNNLDNWKSSRRKRQEDVIERLTEVKKMEEDVGGSRRRAKTFGEMMQDRNGKGRRILQVFTDDDNDISSLLSAKSPTSSDTKSDLGFATSSDTGSEPSDQQEPEKCAASPTAGETNGHDSGTDEFTYDSAIQGYMKFAEKTAATARLPATVDAASPALSLDDISGPGREPSPRAASPLEKHETHASSHSAVMSTSAPAPAPASASAPVSAPVSAQASAPAPAPVKTGKPSVVLREKKAKVDVLKRRSMFEQRSGSEERSPAAQRRQYRKSMDLSDGLRHRIASLETVSSTAGDEARWRPQGKGDQFRQKLAMFAGLENSREASADRRGPIEIPRQKSASDLRSRFEQLSTDEPIEPAERPRSSLERGERRPSEPETRHWRHGSLDARRSLGASFERRVEAAAETTEARSLETTVRRTGPAGSAVSTVCATERRVETVVSTVERRVEELASVEVEERAAVAREASPPPPAVSPLTNGLSPSVQPEAAPSPEPPRVPPVPREIPTAGDVGFTKPASWAPVLAPGSTPTPYTAPAAAPAPVAAPVARHTAPEPEPEPAEDPAPTPAADPAPAPVQAAAAAPAAVEELTLQSEPVSAVWEDPSETVDEMEARILRQLEESEQSQMSAAEMPVVLDFTLQPSAAPPPSEKPPPPPPEMDDEPPVETRTVKSTTTVKKDLYRRRSDFLGIQGTAEQEPATAVVRPPDMESLLRQERAQQQEQERRRQAQETARRREQARQESLRRAEEEAETRAEEFRRRAQQEQEQRAQERRALELQQEQERLQEMERQQELERQQQEQERLLEQERRSQEQLLEQQRRLQQEQEQDWRRRSAPAPAAEPLQERWSQEPLSDQEREWRRRKERLSEEDVDRQEREIMESLEQEESWRHSQQKKYQSRLARMQATDQQWQQTQECPPSGGGARGGPADLLTSRQQARSNPNLLREGGGGPGPLAPSRSHGDLQTAGGAPLQHSRSHGRLGEPEPAPAARHHAPAPAKPQRSVEQEIRAPRSSSSRSQLPPQPQPQQQPPPQPPQQPQQPSPPETAGSGQMSRHTLHALSAAPRSNLRQEWVPRKRVDAPRNAGQHWLIQEAEQRRISEQQERSSRQQQQQQQQQQHLPPAQYQPPRAPPPVQQHHPALRPQQHHQQHVPHHQQPQQHVLHHQQQQQQQQQQQYPAFYTQQPIYENTPAQLNSNNYQDISAVRPNYGTQVYHSPEMRPGQPESVSPGAQSAEDRVLSVSGRKKCSHCGEELGRGAAMIIESLRLFYHINCFKCCVCNVQLGNGSMGADVRVRNNKLHCHDCYSNDEGLKFSKV